MTKKAQPTEDISLAGIINRYIKEAEGCEWYSEILNHITSRLCNGISCWEAEKLDILKYFLYTKGNVGLCHALAAMALLGRNTFKYGMEFCSLWELTSNIKRTLSSSLADTVLSISIPYDTVSPNPLLIPGTVYYGKVIQCPHNAMWYQGGSTLRPFEVPMQVINTIAIFKSHPSFEYCIPDKELFEGRITSCMSTRVSIPLSWVTGEYRFIKGQDGKSFFIKAYSPESCLSWGEAFSKPVIVTEMAEHKRVNRAYCPKEAGELTRDDFNTWQENDSLRILPFRTKATTVVKYTSPVLEKLASEGANGVY